MENIRKGFWYIVFIAVFVCASGSLFAGTAPSLDILSPTRGEDIPYGGELVIAISIYDEDGDVDLTSIEFEVDGVDIARDANKSVFLTTFNFTDTTDPGRHSFSFLVKDREGNVSTLDSYFNVMPEPKKERRFTYNGSARAGGEYDKEGRQDVIGLLDANVYGRLTQSVDYIVNIEATNEEASDKQRVSDFRLDLYSPFGGLVAGTTTPSFSEYSIDGEEVWGFHLLPQFGIFGLEFVYGQHKRAVEADEAGDPEAFKQTVYGGRFKVGKVRKIQWGFSFLKVKDDEDSIDTTATSPTPKDNLVLGTDLNLNFLNGKIQFEAEANESLLNEDITGGPSDFEDLDIDLDADKWEWLFVLNEHVVPLSPGLPNLAARGAIKIGPFYENTFRGEYSYIGPSYFSLVNTGIINDRAGFRISDSIWLLDRSLFLNGSYQNYHDNLEDTQTFTTDNIGYSAAAYVYPTDYLSVNGGLDIYTVKNDASSADPDAVDTISTTINGGTTYSLDIWKTSSSVYFDGILSLFKDDIDSANDLDNYSTRFGAISYFDNFPLDTKAVIGYDFGDSPSSVYLEGGGGYRFLRDQKLYAFADAIYETGPEQLDLTIGANYDAPYNLTFEADLEYITAPDVDSNLFISAFATWEF